MELMEIRRRLLMQESGGGEEGMKLVRTYVVPESWEDLTYGNTQYAYNTIIKDLLEANSSANTYIAVYENNNASQTNYKADYMIATGFGAGNSIYFQSVRNNRSVVATALNTTRQFFASQGTTVKVYELFQ